MILRVFQKIVNDVWSVTFVNDPLALSEGDKLAMQQFGEPEINLGGTFLAETENTFTLPIQLAKIRSDFPYTQYFDARDAAYSSNTQVKVLGYRDAIVTLVTAAMTTLREQADTFTSELTYNI
jgi:hypothetical protein